MKKTNFCIDCGKNIWAPYLRCKSCSKKRNLNPNFEGRTITKQLRERWGYTRKGMYEGQKNPNYGKGLFGKNNPNWRGGVAHKQYSRKFKRVLRPIILSIYKECQLCGTKKQLEVHHIDHDKNNNCFTNLITLCKRCNVKECWYDREYKRAILSQKSVLELLNFKYL